MGKNKIEEVMRNIRTNLTTTEIKALMKELDEEVEVRQKINLKEIKVKSDLVSEEDDLSDLFPELIK